MTAPTIHMNGTSAASLLDGYSEARRAVEAAIDPPRHLILRDATLLLCSAPYMLVCFWRWLRGRR